MEEHTKQYDFCTNYVLLLYVLWYYYKCAVSLPMLCTQKFICKVRFLVYIL